VDLIRLNTHNHPRIPAYVSTYEPWGVPGGAVACALIVLSAWHVFRGSLLVLPMCGHASVHPFCAGLVDFVLASRPRPGLQLDVKVFLIVAPERIRTYAVRHTQYL
jgi:hypothetical protein